MGGTAIRPRGRCSENFRDRVAVLELLLMPLTPFFATMGVMMFDAPGSENNAALKSAFLAM